MKNSLRPGARALMTDLYELTMAYGYWKTGKADQEAVFHLFFRKQPFGGGFALCAGLADCIQYLRGFRFEKSDLEYLAQLKGNDGKKLFEPGFLKCLGSFIGVGLMMFPTCQHSVRSPLRPDSCLQLQSL